MAGITTITPTQSRPDTDSCGMKLTLTGTQSGFSSTLDLRPISIKPSYRHGRDDYLLGNTETMRSTQENKQLRRNILGGSDFVRDVLDIPRTPNRGVTLLRCPPARGVCRRVGHTTRTG